MSDAIQQMVQARRQAQAAAGGDGADHRSAPVWGLALSGGGIRSATFGLGVITSLAAQRLLLRFDLLSTVSGGGFIGSTVGRLFHGAASPAEVREVEQALGQSQGRAFGDWLRRNGRYLIPRGFADVRYTAAVMLRNLLGVHVELAFLALMAGCLLAGLNLGAWAWMEYLALHKEAASTSLLSVARMTHMGATAWLLIPPLGLLFVVTGCAYWATQEGPRWRRLAWQLAFWLLWMLAVSLLAGGRTQLRLGSANVDTPLFGAWLFASLAALSWLLAYPLFWGMSAFNKVSKPVLRLSLSQMGSRLLNAVLVLLALGLFDRIAWFLAFQASQSAPPAGLLIAVAVVLRGLLPYLGNSSGGNGFIARRAVMLANAAGMVLAFLVAAWWASLVYNASLRSMFYGASLRYGDVAAALVLIAVPLALYLLATGRNIEFLNLSSLHPFYRARITRSYLGAGNPARFEAGGPLARRTPGAPADFGPGVDAVDPGDDVPLADYRPHRHGGPVHLVNACINQSAGSGGRDFNVDRRGQLLTVAPGGWVHAGAQPWQQVAPERAMSLGTWAAISGAAFSPGLGSLTRTGLATLAMFSGVRLGYWWTMTGRGRRSLLDKSRHVLAETLGRFRMDADRPWYLTDGGHFDNTGVYPLLRERCHLVVLTDCGADPSYSFGDIENLVRKARIDLQTSIEFVRPTAQAPAVLRESVGSLSDLASDHSQACLALARLCYPDGPPGWLIVVKPNMCQDLPVDLENFKAANPEFPQQTTVDQFFDEAQWESYRRLGEEIGGRLTPALIAALQAMEVERPEGALERDDGVLAAEAPTEVSTPARRMAERVSSRLVATGTVGGTLGLGAVIAAVGVPVWQGVDAYRSAVAADDQADRAALKEITEKWGKLPKLNWAEAGDKQAPVNALSDLAAALARTQDILCPRGEGEWFRSSSLARQALTNALAACKALPDAVRTPSCEALAVGEEGNCLLADVSLTARQGCSPHYWGRDYQALSDRRIALAARGPGLLAAGPAGDHSRSCETRTTRAETWQGFEARLEAAWPDWLRGGNLAGWARSVADWARVQVVPPQVAGQPLPAPGASGPATMPGDGDLTAAAGPGSAGGAPGLAGGGACKGFTVYLQTYSGDGGALLRRFQTSWQNQGAAVPGVEDVNVSADRAARRRPVPYLRTTVLYNGDESGAEACANALAASAPPLDSSKRENWEVRRFPEGIDGARRVVEVWFVWPRIIRPMLDAAKGQPAYDSLLPLFSRGKVMLERKGYAVEDRPVVLRTADDAESQKLDQPATARVRRALCDDLRVLWTPDRTDVHLRVVRQPRQEGDPPWPEGVAEPLAVVMVPEHADSNLQGCPGSVAGLRR